MDTEKTEVVVEETAAMLIIIFLNLIFISFVNDKHVR